MKKTAICSFLTAAVLGVTPFPAQAKETGYTLREVDLTGTLGADCQLWSVERTECGTYLLRAGFPHTYTYTNENGETYSKDDYALYYAVADENGELIIPWFMHDTGGRGGSGMEYADGVYSFFNDEPNCYWDPYLEGTVCEFYSEDGKPLFSHDDWVCAGQMVNGYAWVGVAGELNPDWNQRTVKEYQVIDKTGTVLFTIDPNEYLQGNYGISFIRNRGDGVFMVDCYDTVSGNSPDISTQSLLYDIEGNVQVLATSEAEQASYLQSDFRNDYAIATRWDEEQNLALYGIVDHSFKAVVPMEYKRIIDFNENGYWAEKIETDPSRAGHFAMYDWDGNPLTDAIYFESSADSPGFSEDGYIHLRRIAVDGAPSREVLLDALGHEVALPVETYYNEDYTYTELMGYRDGWLRFESYSGEMDENGESIYTSFLMNWEGEKLTFPTTSKITSLENGMYRAGSNLDQYAYYVLLPPEDNVAAGDLTGDGTIDIMDVIKVNKFLLGSVSLSDAEKATADVDRNNEVDSTDSLNILKYVVELIDNLPVS